MRTLGRLIAIILKQWRRLILTSLLSTATVLSNVGLMATSTFVIARAAMAPDLADLQVAIVGVRFFGLVRGILRYLERIVAHDVNFRLIARLRAWFFEKVEPLAPASLVSLDGADLHSRVINDLESLENLYIRAISPPLSAILVSILVSLAIGIWSTPLALTTAISVLIVCFVVPWVTILQARTAGALTVIETSRLSIRMKEIIQGSLEILAFGRQRHHLRSLTSTSSKLGKSQLSLSRAEATQKSIVGLVLNVTIGLIVVIGAKSILAGNLQPLLLPVTVLSVVASYEAVQDLPLAFQRLEENITVGNRLFEIVDSQPVVVDSPYSIPWPDDNTNIIVNDLTFSYQPHAPSVLHNINFELTKGTKLGIVGPSGSGKTTLTHLLLRFWDVPPGTIYIGGNDIRHLSQDDARKHIGLLSQRPFIFNTTIIDNLLFAKPDSTSESIHTVLALAALDDFINDLPFGLETRVGDHGFSLSGGERQRLAIARVFLKDPSILILDEPTANLDAEVEDRVLSSIDQLMKRRTTIHISHRLRSVAGSDEIIVLVQGRIVERGSHSDLMRTDGWYREMWELEETIAN